MVINGSKGDWKVDVGLEIHAQVISESKLFSGASTDFGGAPNSHASIIDAALPGVLPSLNQFVIKQAVKTGLALGGNINKDSFFDRKHYFYPDLPQGYQITQFYNPIVTGGAIEIENKKKIVLRSIHLEQDAGKSIHDQSPIHTYIDLNRAGIALMEIITEPDISSPSEATSFLKELRLILRYINACDGDMENGSLRCDANVSVRPLGSDKLGERCEIKNLNSIRNISIAIESEAKRQIALLESGGTITQETRLFNPNLSTTEFMRKKENAYEYHYFPDPDLPVVSLEQSFVDSVAASLPELPKSKIARYVNSLNLNEYDAKVIASNKDCASFFEKAVEHGISLENAKMIGNWVSVELFGYLNKHSISILQSPVKPSDLADLVILIKQGIISGTIAKQVFAEMCETSGKPMSIIKSRGLEQLSDEVTIEKLVDNILAINQDSVLAYKNGKEKILGFFVGQVMKKTSGKANPSLVNEILRKKLSK
ncbi:Aspartyl/glutamyl-tRNA(Asn/Gln) amidotransferase subunit B [Candidatus Xenohaliotis californiensis]|uniref:Aspartyl/glutamyl-tRNA(Asn/Gln) amidotransferase subunit B n=1 Tax=Candidatus Xenohaliotis californiensis TaxID=84677 RepID=A0ABM9N7Z2_9RICK|nr:Aspartyl/glutamyl-tRNA(Asn/Gln) amidotransferase subunit B [Candidatus Xenohaliotis californiensis]